MLIVVGVRATMFGIGTHPGQAGLPGHGLRPEDRSCTVSIVGHTQSKRSTHRSEPLSSSLRVGRRCRSLWITAMVVGSTTRSESRPAYGEAWTEKRSTLLCGTSRQRRVAHHHHGHRRFASVQCTPTQQLAGSRVSTETRLTGNVPGPLYPASLLTLSLTFDATRPSLSSHLYPSLKRVKRHAHVRP